MKDVDSAVKPINENGRTSQRPSKGHQSVQSSAADMFPPADVCARYGVYPKRYDLDVGRLHRYRTSRLHAEMDKRGCDALLLFDTVNIRYATGARNMQIWTMHQPARYALVLRSGKTVLFEIGGRSHHAEGLPLIDEVRVARPWFYYYAGSQASNHVKEFAAEIADLIGLSKASAYKPRLYVDRCDRMGTISLEDAGLIVSDQAQELMEQARSIKSEDEIAATRIAIDVCEAGIRRIKAELRPGITELSLWSYFHQTNIELGGEYIETRLLTSGPRTNPFHQEASQKQIQKGEMVTFDCDLIGPLGYGADLSRAFVCAAKPTAEQRNLYQRAHDLIMANTQLLQVGRSFAEIIDKASVLPQAYRQWHRVAHGNGMSIGEFPAIGRRPGYPQGSIHEGRIQEGMVLCVGTFAGRKDGGEGVKLEHQTVIRSDGPELLSSSLFDSEFCN
ncbi:M24 family metallopeptidase [Bradyrhizobium sp. STM 3562]|uniref:M24 family metallopeptidase n=1 Tax=Bradyrhizobium sp. STM 3562 TaxID=578924 RepID=UPI00388DE2D4